MLIVQGGEAAKLRRSGISLWVVPARLFISSRSYTCNLVALARCASARGSALSCFVVNALIRRR